MRLAVKGKTGEYGHFSALGSQFIIGRAKDEGWTSRECRGIKSCCVLAKGGRAPPC